MAPAKTDDATNAQTGKTTKVKLRLPAAFGTSSTLLALGELLLWTHTNTPAPGYLALTANELITWRTAYGHGLLGPAIWKQSPLDLQVIPRAELEFIGETVVSHKRRGADGQPTRSDELMICHDGQRLNVRSWGHQRWESLLSAAPVYQTEGSEELIYLGRFFDTVTAITATKIHVFERQIEHVAKGKFNLLPELLVHKSIVRSDRWTYTTQINWHRNWLHIETEAGPQLLRFPEPADLNFVTSLL